MRVHYQRLVDRLVPPGDCWVTRGGRECGRGAEAYVSSESIGIASVGRL
ncbi:MAG: hypothetical protein M3458_03195 [Acidobacteriota bacterium]|nr:hypothetical protein [Acidobacteriota bacterium]